MREAACSCWGQGLTGGGAQIAMTRAYSLHRAAPLAALSGLGIVLTHLLAIPVFGERPTGWQIAGSLLVIGASLLLATAQAPPVPNRPPPAGVTSQPSRASPLYFSPYGRA